MVESLALSLAGTIRHDGHSGVADDLTTPDAATSWVHAQADHLGTWGPGYRADEASLARILALRQAIRALLAHAVHPTPPSPADANRLLPIEQAVDRLNAAAALAPTIPKLRWTEGPPSVTLAPATPVAPTPALLATLARSCIDLLTGPHRPDLRACTAPRCVRYFVKNHGRQGFCKPSCGNRARAARHYHRHREPDGT